MARTHGGRSCGAGPGGAGPGGRRRSSLGQVRGEPGDAARGTWGGGSSSRPRGLRPAPSRPSGDRVLDGAGVPGALPERAFPARAPGPGALRVPADPGPAPGSQDAAEQKERSRGRGDAEGAVGEGRVDGQRGFLRRARRSGFRAHSRLQGTCALLVRAPAPAGSEHLSRGEETSVGKENRSGPLAPRSGHPAAFCAGDSRGDQRLPNSLRGVSGEPGGPWPGAGGSARLGA